MTIDMAEMLSRTQVSISTGLSGARVDQAVRRGELPYIQTPLGRLFRREDVEAWNVQRRERLNARKRKQSQQG